VKILRNILLVVFFLVVMLAVAGFLFFWDITRGPLPQQSGSVNVSGLQDRVEIIREPNGIPHIYASNLHDLFFAQGYTQAQDRWWQMEFYRHTGNGRIQELTGKNDGLMGTDVFIRTIGWRRAAERELESYDPVVLEHLQHFADGVNAYITTRSPGDLAMEYSVLGLTGVNITVSPWTPADTLVWAKVMQWDLSGNSDSENYNRRILDALGEDLYADLVPAFPYDEMPTILQAEDLPITEASANAPASRVSSRASGASILAAGNLPLDTGFILGNGAGIGSNNWVVSGSNTASGRPLLANDPHLSIGMPAIWYEVGLHCQPVTDDCPMDVRGFTFAPNPAVVIGHNANIAWGVTNVGPDTQDLYQLTINPDNELQYRWNDDWRDITVHEETLNFGDGEAPITIRVRETHLGPIINDNQINEETGAIMGFNNEDPVAFRWTALDGGTLFEAVVGINQASNWEEFRQGVSLWDSPSQNFVYADVQGNIGYQTPSNIPIRAQGESGTVPTDCAEDVCEWQGYIPFENLPRIFNPERGYIATANQAVVPLEFYAQLAETLDAGFNYEMGTDWDIGYRGLRINEMLATSTEHTPESMQAIQGDNKFIVAEQLAPTLEALVLDDAGLAELRDWMLDWDYQLNLDTSRGAFFVIFVEKLSEALFNDQLALADGEVASGSDVQLYALVQLVSDPENLWWDDVNTTDTTETRDDILVRALAEAREDATALMGANRDAWRWGAQHTATFVSNPLGLSGVDLIEGMVNRGPIETSGGRISVNAISWNFGRGDFTVGALPSMRMIIDVGEWDNSLTIHTTGQSGHPFSPNYFDMNEDWRTVRYHPMRFTRDNIAGAAGVNTLILNPAP
jgi:penicillin G amidase